MKFQTEPVYTARVWDFTVFHRGSNFSFLSKAPYQRYFIRGHEMEQTKILIVDDEKLSRQKIMRLIKDYPEDFTVFTADHGFKALEVIENQKPDIVFLDIEMPEMNGMDLVQSIKKPKFKLIFQTAYSDFAVQAFEKNAIDYLLKPFNQKRFNQALDKALNQLNKGKKTTTDQLDQLSSQLIKNKVYLSQFVVKRGLKNTLIPVDEIYWFKSENHYTYLCIKDFEYIYTEPLKDLSLKLDPKLFFQVHRNAIVHLKFIREVIQGDNMKLILKNGTQVSVSRSHKKMIKKLLNSHR